MKRQSAAPPIHSLGPQSVRIEPRDAEVAGRIAAYLHVAFARRQGRSVFVNEAAARSWLADHPLVLVWVAEHLTQEGLGPEWRRWWRP